MHKNLYKIIKNKGLVQGGLTLIELMVVIGIFLIITTTVIANYGGFKSSVSLQNLTDDIALSIRKAQSFAIGARGAGGKFDNSYGVHFSTDTTSITTGNLNSSSKSFLMFSSDGVTSGYKVGTGSCGDKSGNNSCIEYFSIKGTDKISSISLDGKDTTDGFLDIIFIRPNPRAYFCSRTSLESNCDTIISSASIKISNGLPYPDTKTKTISVQNTGQISVDNE